MRWNDEQNAKALDSGLRRNDGQAARAGITSERGTMPAMRILLQTQPLAAEAPRYYQIQLQQDLLGGWTLTREWGQQGGRVSLKREVFLERDDALAAFEHARDAQLKRGFRLMFSQGIESPYS